MSSYLPLQMSRSRISTDLLSGLSTQLPHTVKPTISLRKAASWTARQAIVPRLRNLTIRFSIHSPSRSTTPFKETSSILTVHPAPPLPILPVSWRLITLTMPLCSRSVDHTRFETGLQTLSSRTRSQDYATVVRLSWDSGQRGMW